LEGGVIEGDEIAKANGDELEAEDPRYPQTRFVRTRRVTNPDPPPPLALEAHLDAQVEAAQKLVADREAARVEAGARLTRAEQARADAPRDDATLIELEAAERAEHVAALDVKATQKACAQIVARVGKTKTSGKLAELQKLADQQSDAAVMKLAESFAQRAGDAGKQLGKAVAEGLAAFQAMMAARSAAERLAEQVEIQGWRPGRLDREFLITKIAAAFATGFQTATKLPRHAISRWTGA